MFPERLHLVALVIDATTRLLADVETFSRTTANEAPYLARRGQPHQHRRHAEPDWKRSAPGTDRGRDAYAKTS